ncbi:MAG: poly-beta-1,6-N-acetyl-D-glucosamine synthase [Granulosicoccaceae bacterium]|jgi:biofilm PGA synthesis N-glycosyltransferase PgaC
MNDIFAPLGQFLLQFAYYYPLFMAYVWIIGAISYYVRWECRGDNCLENVPDIPGNPRASIIVPCHNEGENLRDTIEYLSKQDYANYDIIAVNDGSTDNTAELLEELKDTYPKLRVIHLATNQGKAMAMRVGMLFSSSEYLVCIDGDALLDRYATSWLMHHLTSGPRVGAVTGNPRVRNRSTLLGKIQVGEFSSIIGMIKRAQRIYGRVFTVSGVVAGFRRTALHQVGYWSTDMVTEDIDISWKLQLNHWDIRFEPNALCWILMPETLKGLFNQRVRWSQGGTEVLLKYINNMFSWRKRRMWIVYVEYFTSVFWAISMVAIVGLWALGKVVALPPAFYVPTLVPGWNGVILGMTCLLQFAVSLAIDSRYEKGIGKYYYWMIWYPMAYWMINVATTMVAVPKALFKKRGTRATWVSPDRGIK